VKSWARRILRPVLTITVVGAVLYFFATTLAANWDRVQRYSVGVNFETVGATTIFALAVVVSGWLWALVLRALGERHIGVWSATEAHLGSWLVRYIPSVAQPLYKVSWASARGVRRATAFLAFLYEFAFVQIASIMGALVVLVIARSDTLGNDQVWSLSLLLVVTGAIGLVALRYLINPIATRVARLRRIEEFDSLPTMPWRNVTPLVGAFTLPRIINGVGIGLLTVSLLPGIAMNDVVAIAAAYTIAGAIGVLWVFIPSGIGVREATFVAILAAIGFDVVDAIAIAVLARLSSTISDLLVAGVYGTMKYFSKSSDRNQGT
jgi:glycosyltransferase 2 family protein